MPSSHNVYLPLTPTTTDDDDIDELSLSRPRSLGTRWHTLTETAKETYRNNTGILLVTLSQAFLSVVNVAVKKLNTIDPPVPTLELVFVRMAITYVCCMTYMLSTGVPEPFLGPSGVRWLLAFRGFSGFFGVFGIYYSLEFLSLSDATVLTFLSPLCTAIAGSLFLKERFGRKEAAAGIVSLLGVVLIARPVFIFGDPSTSPGAIEGVSSSLSTSEKGTPTQRLIAVGVALVGVLGATGAYTSLTAIGKRAHPMHSLTSFSIQCVIVSTIAMVVTKTSVVVPKRFDWGLLLLTIGIFGFIAQIFLAMGLARESAGRGTIAIYSQIVFATILEQMFFDTKSSILSLLGTIIIMAAALYVALTKEKDGKQGQKSIRLREFQEGSLEEGLLQGKDEESTNKSQNSQSIEDEH